eukprot:TRINITY_DN24489_c0_g1_i1.p1 TRINITY_DN24489_c0_g1~~TRINITY_DN24489_c0_g1_i1.p1  ORF type:complete len:420 (+),score=79.40 TRINITY_DN24489_c0_g1_i1:81-1340(+)
MLRSLVGSEMCIRDRMRFPDGKFVPMDGLPFCEAHARERVAPWCAYCGQKILEERFTQALGRSYHRGHFKCAKCNQSLDGQAPFHTANGKPYCAKDYGKLFCPKCEDCNEPVMGEAMRALGGTWHPEHFVCAHCRKPIPAEQGFYHHEEKVYCQRDYEANFTPVCGICGVRTGRSYSTNFWGDVYCTKHQKEMPNCFSCGRLVATKQGCIDYADGRSSCELCAQTAIMNPDEARQIMLQVADVLGELGIPVEEVDMLEVQLGDRHTLKSALQQYRQRTVGKGCVHEPKEALGLTAKVLVTKGGGFFRSERSIDHVSVLQGLPAHHMGSVFAHELGHVYLWMNGFPELSSSVEEGICELFKWLWLQAVPPDSTTTFLMEAMTKNKDKIYGGGFRAARASFEKMASLQEFLEAVRSRGKLP